MTASGRYNAGYDKLAKVYTIFCRQDLLIAFLNGMDVCAQTTPLIAFLKHDKSIPEA